MKDVMKAHLATSEVIDSTPDMPSEHVSVARVTASCAAGSAGRSNGAVIAAAQIAVLAPANTNLHLGVMHAVTAKCPGWP